VSKSCPRYEPQSEFRLRWLLDSDLSYVNLDERHAWKVLQQCANEIISCNRVSIAPHDLRLGKSLLIDQTFIANRRAQVTAVSKTCDTFLLHETMSWSDGYLSEEELEQQFPVTTTAPKRYIFARIDRVHVGDSGAPKLASGPRASLQPEPDWLEAEVWDEVFDSRTPDDQCEAQDEFRLKSDI